VARPELGTKRVCPTTGRKFYDLNRDPIVSPYTGQVLPRSSLEPMPKTGAPAPVADEDEEELETPAGPEVISLEEAAASEDADATAEDEVAIEDDDAATDDAFLEEEEEEGGDVSDLIDGDIEDEEEA
jgi:uncharacterized protein (TIGR02300 family)